VVFVKSAAISSMEDPLKLLTNLKSLKIENSDKLKEKSQRERERESNSSLRRLLGLKDFGSESMDDG
jgi:hypothetical protein